MRSIAAFRQKCSVRGQHGISRLPQNSRLLPDCSRDIRKASTVEHQDTAEGTGPAPTSMCPVHPKWGLNAMQVPSILSRVRS